MIEFKELASAIKKARLRAGFSQGELGKASGLGTSTIGKLEQGRSKSLPDDLTLAKVAKPLALNYEELVKLRPTAAAPTNRVPFFVSPEDLDLWTQMAQAEDPPLSPEQLFTEYAQEFRHVLTKRRLAQDGRHRKAARANRQREAQVAGK